MAPRRVVMVVESDYPTLGGGGAEKQVQTLCRHLPPGVRATVVTPRIPWRPRDAAEVDGTPVIRIAYPHVRLVGGIVLLARFALYLFRERGRIDAIHSHIAHNMSAVAALVGRILGIPVVIKLTGQQELEAGILSRRRNPANLLRRWAVKRATWVQTVSREIEQTLYGRGFSPKRVRFLPNAVDSYRFAPIGDDEERAALKRDLDVRAGRIAVYVGRLSPEKSLDTLLAAWGRVAREEADAQLLLIGYGKLHAALETQAAALGIAHQVRLIGPSARVPDYWKVADFGVLPSEQEGLSNALLEAMASCVPMIGSRISGTADVLEEGRSGWLFEPRSVDQLEACLRDALGSSRDRLRELGKHARAAALAYAGVDRIVGELQVMYGITPHSGTTDAGPGDAPSLLSGASG